MSNPPPRARRASRSELPDGALLRRARRGDEHGFAELFDRHADAVFRYATVRLRSRDAAKDVVSYVFGEAWRQRNAIEPMDGSLRPWLFAVARNRTARMIASQVRRGETYGQVASQASPDHAERVAERLDSSVLFADVLAAIERLPAGARDALTLHVWGELSYEEIAQELGIEVGTVKSRLSRARQRLAALLHPDDHPAHLPATVVPLFTPEDQR